MKNSKRVLSFATAVGAALLLAVTASAQAPATAAAPPAAPVGLPPLSNGPAKIATIQWDAALLNTKDGKSAQADLEKRLGPKQQELQKREDDLRGLQEQLQRGGTTISDTKKADLQKQIESGTKSLQRDSQDFNDEAQAEERKVFVELSEKMQPVVKKFAIDNGYTLLINVSDQNSNVLWAADGLDITAAVIDAYDKTAPAAPVAPKTTAPKPPAATGARPPAIGAPAAPKPAPGK
ncbi:MAG TPA: OmpH family outer membrane protein [Bryobacteraceae bacterium]